MPAFPGDSSLELVAGLTALPSSTPVSEIAQRLLDLFTSGSVEAGTRLPPERQLAATLGVGRSAVREALAALEILGIVDVRPGSGTYLRGAASDLLPQTLRWGLLIGERNTAELLELREGLEIYVARLAAKRADAAALDAMRQSVADMRRHLDALDEGRNAAAFAAADARFHDTLAQAADNAALKDMLHVVRSLLRVYADRAVTDADAARVAVAEHDDVLAAVAAGDENGAAAAMAQHMATASARLAAVGD